jgi:Ni/Co efflux regulator RcnB
LTPTSFKPSLETEIMKLFIAAAALIVALPAAAQAQSQPAQAEHHGEHKGMDHGKEHKGCCEHKNADGTPMDCCKLGKDGTRPACCEKHDAKAGHKGHDKH